MLQEEKFVQDILENKRFTFAVIENKSGELIGLVSLMKVDTRNGKAELGTGSADPTGGGDMGLKL